MLLADDEAACAAWDAFVRSLPDATFFHLSGWRRVMRNTFRHTCHYLVVCDGGVIVAGLPLVEIRSKLFGHALISTAFCVGGGPLASDENSISTLLGEAEQLGRKLGVDYIELRDTPHTPENWRTRDDLYAGFEGPIAPEEADNLKQIPRKQRAVVRKAMASNFTTTIDCSPDSFFPLYARTVRDHGTPALPRRYFKELLSVFGPDCEILTICDRGRPISSVLSYYFRDRVLPYYTGSLREARAVGANDMMYWALMRRAVDRGCRTFDFGRSKIGTGPFSFKRNWGFEPRPIAHQYRLLKSDALPNINPTNPHYALLIDVWRRLPIPVANAISPLLSRNLA